MYERISIQGFRGVKELTIDHLAPINILIGKNGSGKSTVLEALWVHAVPDAPFFGEVDKFRNFAWDMGAPDAALAPWQHLFYKYEPDPIVISGRANNQSWTIKLQPPTDDKLSLSSLSSPKMGERIALNARLPRYLIYKAEYEQGKPLEIKLVATPEGGFAPQEQYSPRLVPSINTALLSPPSLVLPQMAVGFGRVDIKNKRESVIKVAKILEPKLERLASVSRSDGKSYLYADIGQKDLLPVQLLGGGFVSVLCIAIVAVDMESGVLLIDEIENGIHYSALQDLWKGLWGLHEETGVQIVATTHSLECVEAARAVLPSENAFLVHRLERDTGQPGC
jgi:energy-coupling factor transporter ATP-binding protein EcfA2